MKKKNIIIALVCLFVLILPTTIYAGLCSGHIIEEKKLQWESRGPCKWEIVNYKYCTKNCGYKEYTAHGAVFTQHDQGNGTRLPDVYRYTNITSTQHTKVKHMLIKCANYKNCGYTFDYAADSTTQKHSCANHVNKGQTTIHCCSCGKTKSGTSGNHW